MLMAIHVPIMTIITLTIIVIIIIIIRRRKPIIIIVVLITSFRVDSQKQDRIK